MKKNKFAFTLVETLIMMAVIGIIATVTAVSLKGMRPDKDKIMIKKAYSTIVNIVDALLNDTELYPYAHVAGLIDKLSHSRNIESAMSVWPTTAKSNCEGSDETYDELNGACLKKNQENLVESFGGGISEGNFVDKKSQYDNGDGEVGSGKFTDITVRNGADYSTENKFAYNFIKNLDTFSWESPEGRYCSAYTKDGMDWIITDFFDGNKADLRDDANKYPNYFAKIKVDINGEEKGPNSSEAANPDIFTFIVDADGAVSVYGDDAAARKAKEVLKSRNIKADK